MNKMYLGANNVFNENLYIQLHTENSCFVKTYKNIVIQYDEERLTIPVEQLFKKLKELFKENKDE